MTFSKKNSVTPFSSQCQLEDLQLEGSGLESFADVGSGYQQYPVAAMAGSFGGNFPSQLLFSLMILVLVTPYKTTLLLSELKTNSIGASWNIIL